MDEVRAAQALQRVAYAEDWLGRLKDDLAAGHRRAAFTHLMTAQAELKLLGEQLAADLGVVDIPARAPAQVQGLPLRSPFSWAALGASAVALLMFSLQILPGQLSRPASEATQPAPIVAAPPEPQAPKIDRFLASSTQFQALLSRASSTPAEPESAPLRKPAPAPSVAVARPQVPRRRITPPVRPSAGTPAVMAPAEQLAPVPSPVVDPAPASVDASAPSSDRAFVASLLAAKAFFKN